MRINGGQQQRFAVLEVQPETPQRKADAAQILRIDQANHPQGDEGNQEWGGNDQAPHPGQQKRRGNTEDQAAHQQSHQRHDGDVPEHRGPTHRVVAWGNFLFEHFVTGHKRSWSTRHAGAEHLPGRCAEEHRPTNYQQYANLLQVVHEGMRSVACRTGNQPLGT
ncbi:hypothetical protein ALP74_200249 [Pseudomonas coronafaciens pv. garcae]|uniref:Uncharacterized protein n=1 Tax=Pseudomonas coronafaciens pv. garcae TaxID=251653 RepID=A0AB37QJ91_9PSED|nr:hypothetical protein ALP74_200249 [Pseudomonas coronafaciens pv. garcae]